MLRAQGWDKYLVRHLRYGGKVIGICGGLQMLGQVLHDPHGIEGEAGSSPGLGLLDLSTTLQTHKQLHNVCGHMSLHNAAVSGYEIHAGVSEGSALQQPFARLADGRHDGAISSDGQIIATYLHGVFESPKALTTLLEWAGLKSAQTFDYHLLREQNIERLADTLETHLDMPRIMKLLGAES